MLVRKNCQSFQRSNAAQMRKYRAKQRSDPIRYREYLERERMRNYKRKYEKKIQAAQEEAQSLGIPYIVLEPPAGRGRKPLFGDMSLVLPAKYEDDTDDEYASGEMPVVPVKVELKESNKEQKPQISVVNINKLIGLQRSALSTLMPQEVNGRKRATSSFKSEYGHVKHERLTRGVNDMSRRNKRKKDRNELLKLQSQCRDFISNRTLDDANVLHLNQNRQHRERPKVQRVRNDPVPVPQHEDFDDLFKELAEVARKRPKKKHSASPGKHFIVKRTQVERNGEFSLTVPMPVQRIGNSTPVGCIVDKNHKPTTLKSEENFAIQKTNTLKESVNEKRNNVVMYNTKSIDIKKEVICSDDDIL